MHFGNLQQEHCDKIAKKLHLIINSEKDEPTLDTQLLVGVEVSYKIPQKVRGDPFKVPKYWGKANSLYNKFALALKDFSDWGGMQNWVGVTDPRV